MELHCYESPVHKGITPSVCWACDPEAVKLLSPRACNTNPSVSHSLVGSVAVNWRPNWNILTEVSIRTKFTQKSVLPPEHTSYKAMFYVHGGLLNFLIRAFCKASIAVYSRKYWNYLNVLCTLNEEILVLKDVLHRAATVLQGMKMYYIFPLVVRILEVLSRSSPCTSCWRALRCSRKSWKTDESAGIHSAYLWSTDTR
jgi:hypothetical protein